LDLGISGHTLARLLDLGRGFEEEGLHLAFGKAAVEVKERTVLGSPGVAKAVGFATFHVAFDQGGVQEVGAQFKGAQEMRLALAQGQRRGALERLYLAHISM
jgi:hypothetical protein